MSESDYIRAVGNVRSSREVKFPTEEQRKAFRERLRNSEYDADAERSGQDDSGKDFPDSEESQTPLVEIENPQDFVQVPSVTGLYGGSALVSKFEIEGANNKDYEDTHRFVLGKEGLYVPPTGIFMPHFANVCKAARGETQLLDGNGNPIEGKDLEDIYKHLTTNHIAAYRGETSEGAWTWLNGQFVKGQGFRNLDLEMVVGLESDGTTLKKKKIDLADCLGKNSYAKIKFNSQGFPTEKHGDKYVQGENVYFWKPVENRVAGFSANSGGAYLGCGRGPSDSNDSLGVFACAEGASTREK